MINLKESFTAIINEQAMKWSAAIDEEEQIARADKTLTKLSSLKMFTR